MPRLRNAIIFYIHTMNICETHQGLQMFHYFDLLTACICNHFADEFDVQVIRTR